MAQRTKSSYIFRIQESKSCIYKRTPDIRPSFNKQKITFCQRYHPVKRGEFLKRLHGLLIYFYKPGFSRKPYLEFEVLSRILHHVLNVEGFPSFIKLPHLSRHMSTYCQRLDSIV